MGRQHGRCNRIGVACAATGLLLGSTAWGEPAPGERSWALTVKQLEWQDSSTPEALMWDVSGWVGNENNRLWIRDEGGRHVSGARHDNRLELLWGHPLRRWAWMDKLQVEMLLGVRHDSGTTPTRTYGALGFQGQLPFGVRFEGTGYLGDGSRMGDDIHSGVRAQLERDWEVTDRLALTLRAELEAWSEDHVRYSEGHGPSLWSAGVRARYRIHENVAPYIGVEWFDLVLDAATLAVAAGEAENETRFVAGLRLQFGSR